MSLSENTFSILTGISGQELDKSIEDIQSIIVCWK